MKSLVLSLLVAIVLLGSTSSVLGIRRCGYTCLIYCPCGRVMRNGCPTCRCKPCYGREFPINKRCPPLCKIGCPCGNVIKNGCKICKCRPCKG